MSAWSDERKPCCVSEVLEVRHLIRHIVRSPRRIDESSCVRGKVGCNYCFLFFIRRRSRRALRRLCYARSHGGMSTDAEGAELGGGGGITYLSYIQDGRRVSD